MLQFLVMTLKHTSVMLIIIRYLPKEIKLLSQDETREFLIHQLVIFSHHLHN